MLISLFVLIEACFLPPSLPLPIPISLCPSGIHLDHSLPSSSLYTSPYPSTPHLHLAPLTKPTRDLEPSYLFLGVRSHYSFFLSNTFQRLIIFFVFISFFFLFLSFLLAFRPACQGCLIFAGRGGSAPSKQESFD